MDNKALYILAGYDDATEEHLAEIQKKLYESGFTGVHTKDLPQHITLDSFPTEQEETLIGKIKEVAARTPPFEVTFSHAGIFTGAKVLFIAPDKNRPLLRLKEEFGSSDNWTPHTTMLIDRPEVIFEALPIVMESFSSFRGTVTSLHLYEFFPTRYIATFPLQTK
ncbi:MAG: 2'-5' RNA ligase family protein [Clostridiales bacterium]|nr:2'-5' RNA ligase family protein [Clostridiales bacterium]